MKLVKLCAFGVFALSLILLGAKSENSNSKRDSQLPSDFLAIERTVRLKIPVLNKGLEVERPYSRRMPPHWNEVNLTDRQVERIYEVQKEYYEEIALLEARIARLEEERDEKMRDVLTSKQRDKLDAILADAEQAREEKAQKAKSSKKKK